jgi:hypothetical protein
MTNSLQKVAASAGVAAYTMSAALQIYRAHQGTGLAVDRFSLLTGLGYGLLLLLSLTLLTDRRWAWGTNLVVGALLFLQAPFGYYPWVSGSRRLEVWDWLEGTWFTALLFLVVACAVARFSRGFASRHAPELSRS